jgi:hypothetical protein
MQMLDIFHLQTKAGGEMYSICMDTFKIYHDELEREAAAYRLVRSIRGGQSRPIFLDVLLGKLRISGR